MPAYAMCFVLPAADSLLARLTVNIGSNVVEMSTHIFRFDSLPFEHLISRDVRRGMRIPCAEVEGLCATASATSRALSQRGEESGIRIRSSIGIGGDGEDGRRERERERQ